MAASKANPGGQLPIDQIVGRDDLAQQAWDYLRTQSLQMTAERRMGKTSLLRKMEAEPPADFLVIFKNLEHVHTAEEFARTVYEDVEKHLGGLKKTARRAKDLLKLLGGAEVGGLFKLPPVITDWKSLLFHAIEDLVKEQDKRRVVFFWDELPYMLDNIRRSSEGTAMEVLDTLRSIRQAHPDFRMICTGSIGLHHVLTALKQQGHANAPMNDVYQFAVPPLGLKDAQELAHRLIAGEKLQCPDPDATAESLAKATDGVAYYIHHVVRNLQATHQLATPETISSSVESQMLDANDPWELKHFRERLATYYGDRSSAAMVILDSVATAPSPMKVDEILNHLRLLAPTFDDREKLIQLLREMDQDHYLQRTASGYVMRYALISKWWRIDRDLN
jgi:hypothetical protein